MNVVVVNENFLEVCSRKVVTEISVYYLNVEEIAKQNNYFDKKAGNVPNDSLNYFTIKVSNRAINQNNGGMIRD